jgi:hypothetical protein
MLEATMALHSLEYSQVVKTPKTRKEEMYTQAASYTLFINE